ncbi:tripartite tricarboxylate transporter substrate binding protein [Lampropedia puyangensis]|uniref:Tripartite tricarboxylate transporter substrate binding protein n=1 Tax=Lampropedia puyangensis TaxID=1330072 RepID=A0A4S8FBI7_9BURK|nr:tripartite tricarboxylate transporter substrate binding protein [Lampropedia puyangensis]THU05048.1 tripartite tricarboxylate transporter substrate binding protein [Lampropedia puyangensis]
MRKLSLIAASLFSMALLSPALAQESWPNKPIKLVVPYPPGGNVDVAARIIGDKLQERLKQPFIVDNRPGAGGMIAAEFVKKADPDGYTLFVGANGPILFSPTIFKKDSYNWKTDFAPVSTITFAPLVLQVHPSTPYQTVQDLLTEAKKPGNTLTMASPGAGTQNHLASEYLQRSTGSQWITVHYRGNAPATTDLIGGQVDFNFDQMSVAQPFIKDGRTRPIAVTSATRLPQLPNVPTLVEAGFTDFTAETFTGVMAPKQTPTDIVHKLSSEMQSILAEPAIQKRFEELGVQAKGMTPEDFNTFLNKEDQRWIPVIKEANINAN